MKKIFIVFIISVIIATVLVFPCAASMTSSFGSYNNLFDPSDVVQARFYIDSNTYQDNNFYLVDLKSNTDYTFISTKGTRRFYFGESVLDSQNYNSVYSYSSLNLFKNFSPALSSSTINGVTCTYNRDGSFTLNGVSSSDVSFILYRISLDDGLYTLYNLSGSDGSVITYHMSFEGSYNGTYFDYRDYGSSVTFNGKGKSGTIYFTLRGGVVANNLTIYPMLVSGDTSKPFEVPYIDPVYSNSDLSVVTFNSGNFTADTYIGINDLLSGSTSNLFSSNQSSENEFYLIEGKLTVDQISDIIDGNNYTNGYNSGFNQGYKEGEYDGMNSTNIFKSVILTIFSGPFVVVSNALNFEIFGINLYTFIQIILTILIVAFLITRLKGRE